jgi:4-amino-4-deoxy-L-arabinose transferase-like glycosyltransferase
MQFLVLALLLLLYILIALAHAYLAPLTTGPDELAHYEYVRFIADHGRLPLNRAERDQASYKSDQPPLFHLIAALPASLIDPTGPPHLKRVGDHNRRQLIERTRHFWGLYNTEDEQWPYRAEGLRWQMGRWLAILFGAATVAVTFFITRYLFVNTASVSSKECQGGEWLAIGAAAVVAFMPRFALTGSMLNYETTLAFLAALFLWILLRLAAARRPRPNDTTRTTPHAAPETVSPITLVLLLGLVTGLAITTKLSAVILPFEVVVALWLIGKYQGWVWTKGLRLLSITVVTMFVAISWWFGFIVYQFNTIARDGLWVGLLRPLIAADASDATTNRLLSLLTDGQAGFTGAIENLDTGPPWAWAATFFRTFWVVGIEGVQPLGRFGLLAALVLCLLAGFGLVRIWRRSNDGSGDSKNQRSSLSPPDNIDYEHGQAQTPSTINTFDNRLVLSLLLLHLAMPAILPLLRYAVTASLADTAQGRHILFIAAPAFAILLVWGFAETIAGPPSQNPHPRTPIPHPPSFLPALFLLLWTGAQLWSMTWAYNPLLPVQTLPQAKAQAAQRLDQPLTAGVTLVGFDHQFDADGRMLRFDLIWQATTVSPNDYLTEVSLLDERGELRSQWLGYPANGRYPTRAWDVGDIVRDTIWLPVAGLPPGSYEVTLNLISTSLNRPGQRLESTLRLTSIDLSASPPAEIEFWQDGRPLTGPTQFRYRETILMTLGQFSSGEKFQVQVVGPLERGNQQIFDPLRYAGETVLFIVGPDWSSGAYELRLTRPEAGEGEEPLLTSGPLINVIDHWQREFTPPPMSHVVEANFANQVKLLGYDLGANRAEPGGGIPVTFYWQGLDWLGQDYLIFTRLLAADQTAHGGRDRLPQEGYRTLYWAPGEIIVDPFGVPVEADAPDGIYNLTVGLYKQIDEQAISLPLVQDGHPIEATSVNIGPIKIGQTPPGLTQEIVSPQFDLNQPFGDAPNLTLLGYDVSDPAQTVPNLNLTLYWRSESPLPIDYTVFVHLHDQAGEIVAQQDQPPLYGAYPTSLWEPGEIIADEIVISLPPDLSPGSYRPVIGLYDFRTAARLNVPDHPDNSLALDLVRIK